jgi:hypothetical protein
MTSVKILTRAGTPIAALLLTIRAVAAQRSASMLESTFLVLLFLPSVGLVFVVLTTFYGSHRAYVAISWVPLALVGILWAFHQLDFLGRPVGDLGTLEQAVAWTSLVQATFGLGLLLVAIRRRAPWAGLLAATAAVASAFVLTIR